MTPSEDPSPDLILETLTAYQRSDALRAAIELDLFTAVCEGHRTPEALAKRCGADVRGMRVLADSMVLLGLLAKHDQRLEPTRHAELYLDRRAEGYLGDSVQFVAGGAIAEGFSRLSDAVRRGGTALPRHGTLDPEHPAWITYARSMASRMGDTADALVSTFAADGRRFEKILDVAAGHGLFGIRVALANPTAQVVAVDWPGVLVVTREQAERAGLSDRLATLAGSALEVDPGDGYDLVIFGNFLHHFSKDSCVDLLRRYRDALRPGGWIAAVEYVPDADRVSPPKASSFALVMLATTPSGDAYTFDEYREMFERAGLRDAAIRSLPGSAQQLVEARR